LQLLSSSQALDGCLVAFRAVHFLPRLGAPFPASGLTFCSLGLACGKLVSLAIEATCLRRIAQLCPLTVTKIIQQGTNMRVFALLALLASFAVHAAPASQESVEALLTVTKTEALMDSLYSGMEQMMRQSIRQTSQGESLNEEQQRALDVVPAKFVAVMREEMSWQKMKPLYVQLYSETFDQEEIDGMLAFYSSPTGQAVLKKMPVVMQKSLKISQSLLQSTIPKMKAAIDDAMKEAKITNQ
jgi:hypothetical protein